MRRHRNLLLHSPCSLFLHPPVTLYDSSARLVLVLCYNFLFLLLKISSISALSLTLRHRDYLSSWLCLICIPGFAWFRKRGASCPSSFPFKAIIQESWCNTKRKSVHFVLNCSFASILPIGWPHLFRQRCCELIGKHTKLDYCHSISTCPIEVFLHVPLRSFLFQESYNDADNILSTSFSEWEVILCTSTTLDLVWAQVLSDPFLRRLILRYSCFFDGFVFGNNPCTFHIW